MSRSSDAAEVDPLHSELVVQAARLVRAVRRRTGQGAQVRILSILDQYGALGVTALAALDRSSQPTMSAGVGRLAETGWVTKEPDPADARASLVRLTDAGRERLAALRAENGRYVADQLAATHHSREEIAVAVAVLRDLLAAAPPASTTAPTPTHEGDVE